MGQFKERRRHNNINVVVRGAAGPEGREETIQRLY
jgi:hypothetical protein